MSSIYDITKSVAAILLVNSFHASLQFIATCKLEICIWIDLDIASSPSTQRSMGVILWEVCHILQGMGKQ